MSEFLTPKPDKTRVSKIPKTPINIPPSPFMKKLGFGTGVSVFRWDRSPRPDATRSPWAVKKLNKRDLPEFIEQRLEKEAKLLKSLKHPNIVGFRACVPGKDGRMTLAMESCESSLADRIEDRKNDNMGPFDSEVILKVALGVARGLDYLHREKSLLHGDMKSFNILIKGDFDEIKICDFGVSMALLPDGSASNPDNFVGTSVWSAPEVVGLSDGPVSSKVDIFAFGLVLWEMIALEIPHTDDLAESDFDISITEDDLENRIGTRPALPPVDLDDSYNSIMEIFYCCTEDDPTVRPSAQLLVEWLEDLTEKFPFTMDCGEELSVFGEFVKGTCNLMCPINERKLRERERLLHPLERLAHPIASVNSNVVSTKRNGNGNYQADPNKIVKSFSRSAAGHKMPSPSDLRPFPVLDMTVSYLIQEIACNNIHSEGWADRYNFVTDRLRAVRQDMVIQNLPPADCITLLKPMVKFHVFAAYWLCESPINAFDPKINTLFLQECIKRLLIMFNIIREKTGDYFNEDRKEFEHGCENCESDEHLIRALYLLINLGNVEALNQATVRLWNCSSGCDKCIETKAFEVSLASWNGNYSKVCKLLRKLPPLLVMAAAVNLPSIRRHALAVMSIAYNNKTLRFPLDVLQETLMWNNKDQVVQECKHYGVAVEKTEDTKLYACFQKGTFNTQVKQLQPFRLNWLDDILSNTSLAKILENHG